MNKDFILKRICIFSGKEIDPNSDEQVITVLREEFNILLPQRRTLEESLELSGKEHEVIDLILQYRGVS